MLHHDVSVVIPTLNEAGNISAAIASAIAASATEIIVADGGSDDKTVVEATRAGASKIVRSLPGRGIQLSAGSSLASREWLLFLHADNRLHPNCLAQIAESDAVVSGNANWGAFRQRIDSPRAVFRAIEWGNAARVRFRSVAFGDQAMFVRADVFRKLGGFAEIPLMEDVELSRRLRKIGRPLLLPGPVMVDPRRWEEKGVVRQTFRNWSIQLAYSMGKPPTKLSELYR